MRNVLAGAVCFILVLAGAAFSAEDVHVQGKLNLNTASVDALEMLPGISREHAETIVVFRNANGPSSKVTDLIQIKGMSFGLINQIRPYLKLEGSSTYTVQCFDPSLWTDPRGGVE